MAPRPKPARFVFAVGMVLTILAAMTVAMAAPSARLIFRPELPLLYSATCASMCSYSVCWVWFSQPRSYW
jgi:hypothetical protein